MPPARASSGAERIAILDGDVGALTAAARTASVSASVGVSSSLAAGRPRSGEGCRSPSSIGRVMPHLAGWSPLSRTKVPGPEVESCSPRLHRLARVKRVGRLRALAWVLATGPATSSLLLRGRFARGDATSVEESLGVASDARFAADRFAARCDQRDGTVHGIYGCLLAGFQDVALDVVRSPLIPLLSME